MSHLYCLTDPRVQQFGALRHQSSHSSQLSEPGARVAECATLAEAARLVVTGDDPGDDGRGGHDEVLLQVAVQTGGGSSPPSPPSHHEVGHGQREGEEGGEGERIRAGPGGAFLSLDKSVVTFSSSSTSSLLTEDEL